jgi:hypothetical protein
VRVGIGVSVRVRDVPVDPAGMLAEVADWVDRHGVEVTRFDDGLVRFSAVDGAVLAELAGPIAAWWQSYEPSTRGEVALRLIGPGGVTEVTYCRPEDAVDSVRVLIGQECGSHYKPGEEPRALRRLAAAVLRRARTGFTATMVRVESDPDCLCVAVAGREPDDRPRSIEFQVADPSSDLDDPDVEGYCLVNEDHIPVYNALVSLQLAHDRLCLVLTRDAADAWALRSTTMTIRLAVDPAQLDALRTGLRRVFAASVTRPAKSLHL